MSQPSDNPPQVRYEIRSGMPDDTTMRLPKGWNDPRTWKNGQRYRLVKVTDGVWDLLEVPDA